MTGVEAISNGVPAFEKPEADNAGTPALAYNEAADRHSWQAMLELFRQTF